MQFPINNYHIQTPKQMGHIPPPMTLYMLFLLSKISSPHFLPNKSSYLLGKVVMYLIIPG